MNCQHLIGQCSIIICWFFILVKCFFISFGIVILTLSTGRRFPETKRKESLMTHYMKKILKKFYIYRLTHFGQPSYIQISKDHTFKAVPRELERIWYSTKHLSFQTLSYRISEVEQMTNPELIVLIAKEILLRCKLMIIFSRLWFRKIFVNSLMKLDTSIYLYHQVFNSYWMSVLFHLIIGLELLG